MSTELNLASRTYLALKWNYIGTVFRYVLQFGVSVLLARLLGPEPFGLMAIALIIVGLGAVVSDLGFGAAIVQKRDLSEEDLSFVSALQLGVGLSLTIVLFYGADWIAGIFRVESAGDVIKATSFLFTLQALGLSSVSLLKRRLQFRLLQMIQLASYLGGYLIVGCAAAILGHGVWSLVYALLSQTAIQSALSLLAAPHRILPVRRQKDAFFVQFGIASFLTGAVSWAFTTLDNAVLGRYFGPHSLGLYSRASLTLSMPTNLVISSLQPVLLSSLSRRTGELEKVRTVYIGSMALVSYVLVPVFATFAVIPDILIMAIYGRKWSVASDFVVPLAFLQPIYGAMALGGPVLMALGKASSEACAQVLSLVAFAICLIVAAQFQATAVVWAAVIACAFRFGLVTKAALKALQASWWCVTGAVAGPLLAGSVAALTGFLLRCLVEHQNLTPAISLLVIAVGQAAVAGALFLCGRRWVTNAELLWVLAQSSATRRLLPHSTHFIRKKSGQD